MIEGKTEPERAGKGEPKGADRAEPKPKLRERILDAAVKLLAEHGARAVTQSRVARAAGIPQGHLTYYYPRRADLLVALARRQVERGTAEIVAFAQSRRWHEAGPDAKQRAFDFVSYLVKHRERTRMLVGLVVEAEEDGALRDLLVANFADLRRLMGLVIARPDEDPDIDLMLGTILGLSVQNLMWGDRRSEAATDAILARLPSWFEWLQTHRRSQ